MTRRVVVVGAGVIGLCTAWYLGRDGADVTVVDSGPVGQGASWGNAGWIVPSLAGPIPDRGLVGYLARSVGAPHSPVYFRPHFDPGLPGWLLRFALSCTRARNRAGLDATVRLASRTAELFDGLAGDGVVFDMWSDGLLFAGLTREAASAQLTELAPLGRHGYRLPGRISSGTELRELEPALSHQVAGGFLVSPERHVDPGSLTAGLAGALRAAGTTVLEGIRVTGFGRAGDRVTAVETRAGSLPADAVVLAAGVWSGALARQLDAHLPMVAGKGYSFSIPTPGAPTRPLYLIEGKVGASPLSGRVRIAGTMEISGIDLRVDSRRLEAMRASAARYLDSVETGAPIADAWAGLRPLAPDGLPIIGRLGGRDNTYVATAHAMLGVTLGPATGQAVARMVLRGEEAPELVPFRADRFRFSRAQAQPSSSAKASASS